MGILKQCKKSPNGKHQMKAHQWEHGKKGTDDYHVVSVTYCHWCGHTEGHKPKGRGWRKK